MRVAVLIINMGGPDSLASIEPYLYKILQDPAIIDIPMPQMLRSFLVKLIIKKRLSRLQKIYPQLGGRSPLLETSLQQAKLLEKALNLSQEDIAFKVFPAMCFWHPFLEEAWSQVIHDGFDRIIALSLFPFYSTTTTGAIKYKIEKLSLKSGVPREKILLIDRFGNHPLFIEALVQHLLEQLQVLEFPELTHLLFSAHSIPLRRHKKGDPYFQEISHAVGVIQKKLLKRNIKVHLSFQSKIGPFKWLSPSTATKIEELASQGVTKLFIYPLGFVADNLETIYELGVSYYHLAQQKGIDEYICLKALNTFTPFIQFLQKIVKEQYTKKWPRKTHLLR